LIEGGPDRPFGRASSPGTRCFRPYHLLRAFNVLAPTPDPRGAPQDLAALRLVSFVPTRASRQCRTISPEELHEAFMVRAGSEALDTEVLSG